MFHEGSLELRAFSSFRCSSSSSNPNIAFASAVHGDDSFFDPFDVFEPFLFFDTFVTFDTLPPLPFQLRTHHNHCCHSSLFRSFFFLFTSLFPFQFFSLSLIPFFFCLEPPNVKKNLIFKIEILYQRSSQ